VTLRGRTRPYRLILRGDVLHLWLDGRVHEIELVPRIARRVESEAATGHTDHLTAPMPGTILKIARREGESYDAFEPIIIMESMKMEMSLTSPSAGVVKELRCGVGDLVELGAVLARLDPSED
jgi:3-methylcrotonyl-CoA carboxylase alpha subunit